MRSLFTPVSSKPKDERYTKKVEVPQYAPSVDKPHIEELIGYEKYSKLLNKINKSNVSEEEKKPDNTVADISETMTIATVR